MPELSTLLSQMIDNLQRTLSSLSTSLQRYRSGLTTAQMEIGYGVAMMKGMMETIVMIVALRDDLVTRYLSLFTPLV